MPSVTRTFRVFVSSTFGDLTAERSELQKEVFPKLRDLCRARGASFQAVDLRWGISRDAAEDQQTMRICLGEIDRCRDITARPNFIILLGNRYGWRPVPEEIPANEFEHIHDHLYANEPTGTDRKLLERWYRRDDNGAVYWLLPREGDDEGYARWRTVERNLSRVLRDAAATLEFLPEQRRRYTASATEQEIAHRGLLDGTGADKSVYAFFRRIQGLPQDQRAGDFLDLDDENRADTDAQARIEDLKDRLRQRLSVNVHEYEARWAEDRPSYDHLDQLCADAYARLSKAIEDELAEVIDLDPLDAEIAAQRRFGEERTKFFVGRTEALRIIHAYLRGSTGHPFVIYGESGTGKSSLMARAGADTAAGDTGTVVFRFIGTVPGSTNIRTLLAGLCRQLRRRYSGDEAATPTEYPDLVRDFREQLGQASKQRPLILILDALDQLSPLHNGRSLVWLPTHLPPHVHIVVSTLPNDCLEALKQKIPEGHRYELSTMPATDGSELLNLWLKEAGRTLQQKQQQQVLRAFERAHGRPLYLRVAFEEARLWRSDTPAADLAPDIHGLIRQLFHRLSTTHGEVLVCRSLSYIAVGKNGLSQDELRGRRLSSVRCPARELSSSLRPPSHRRHPDAPRARSGALRRRRAFAVSASRDSLKFGISVRSLSGPPGACRR